MQSGPVLDVDVAVVGGGLAGLVSAIACGAAGVRTALIDRLPAATRAAEPFDGRCFAIAYGSKRILEGIGVWPLVAAEAQPILEIRVADNHAPLFLHYDHREIGDDAFGWIVESRHLRHALARRLTALESVVPLAPANVARLEQDAAAARLILDDGRTVRARLVVAADGKQSALRRQAGIPAAEHRYGQDAIALTVAHEKPHRGIAVEHFLPAGPFAILPMTGERSSIVWTETRPMAERLMAADETDFLAALRRRFGDFLGAIAPVGPRWHYPLSVVHAARMTGRRLALVGDAAHSIHPIAGQGLNLGIRDVAVLAELIVDACRLGLDPGADALLTRYGAARRLDTMALTAVTDGLNRLFSNDIKPVKLARDIGLALVGTGALTPLRRTLMRHAMGILGPQPRLTRGERL